MALSLIDLWDEMDPSSFNFRGGRPPRANDVFIAVMGVTGSGKSSLIALCSGKPVRIGHNLCATTSAVDVYAYDVSPQRTVYLIDTPGFDDTTRSDAEVLSEIATWLGDSYQNRIYLHGIIYLHRITDLRMQGSARRNLILFRQLCGEDALRKVILVTTRWDEVAESLGRAREKQLVETRDFWGWMVGKGSSYHRHDNTPESARNIIHRLADHGQTITVDLQRELIDEHRRLNDTSAGREIESDLLRQKEMLTGQRVGMEEQLRAAEEDNDADAEEMLREECETTADMIRTMDEKIGGLRHTVEALIAKRDSRIASMVQEQLRERDAEYQDELEQIRQRTQRLEIEKDNQPQDGQSSSEPSETEADTRSLSSILRRSTERTPATSLHSETLSVSGGGGSPIEARWRRGAIPQTRRLEKDNPVTSVSMWGDVVCVIGDFAISSLSYPRLKLSQDCVQSISLGDTADDGTRAWVALYNKTWMASDNLVHLYPALVQGIKLLGLQELQFCHLGPDHQYIARWRNGKFRSSLPAARFPNFLEGRSHVVDISFGCKGTCFFVYAPPGSKATYFCDLKDYYQDLRLFLDRPENNSILILAIALDPSSTTDYILVYTTSSLMMSKKSKKRNVRWCCSDKAVEHLMSSFWKNTAENETR